MTLLTIRDFSHKHSQNFIKWRCLPICTRDHGADVTKISVKFNWLIQCLRFVTLDVLSLSTLRYCSEITKCGVLLGLCPRNNAKLCTSSLGSLQYGIAIFWSADCLHNQETYLILQQLYLFTVHIICMHSMPHAYSKLLASSSLYILSVKRALHERPGSYTRMRALSISQTRALKYTCPSNTQKNHDSFSLQYLGADITKVRVTRWSVF